MNTCKSCKNKDETTGCRKGIIRNRRVPWEDDPTYGCTLHEPKPIEFVAGVGTIHSSYWGMDVPPGTRKGKYKVTLEPTE